MSSVINGLDPNFSLASFQEFRRKFTADAKAKSSLSEDPEWQGLDQSITAAIQQSQLSSNAKTIVCRSVQPYDELSSLQIRMINGIDRATRTIEESRLFQKMPDLNWFQLLQLERFSETDVKLSAQNPFASYNAFYDLFTGVLYYESTLGNREITFTCNATRGWLSVLHNRELHTLHVPNDPRDICTRMFKSWKHFELKFQNKENPFLPAFKALKCTQITFSDRLHVMQRLTRDKFIGPRLLELKLETILKTIPEQPHNVYITRLIRQLQAWEKLSVAEMLELVQLVLTEGSEIRNSQKIQQALVTFLSWNLLKLKNEFSIPLLHVIQKLVMTLKKECPEVDVREIVEDIVSVYQNVSEAENSIAYLTLKIQFVTGVDMLQIHENSILQWKEANIKLITLDIPRVLNEIEGESKVKFAYMALHFILHFQIRDLDTFLPIVVQKLQTLPNANEDELELRGATLERLAASSSSESSQKCLTTLLGTEIQCLLHRPSHPRVYKLLSTAVSCLSKESDNLETVKLLTKGVVTLDLQAINSLVAMIKKDFASHSNELLTNIVQQLLEKKLLTRAQEVYGDVQIDFEESGLPLQHLAIQFELLAAELDVKSDFPLENRIQKHLTLIIQSLEKGQGVLKSLNAEEVSRIQAKAQNLCLRLCEFHLLDEKVMKFFEVSNRMVILSDSGLKTIVDKIIHESLNLQMVDRLRHFILWLNSEIFSQHFEAIFDCYKTIYQAMDKKNKKVLNEALVSLGVLKRCNIDTLIKLSEFLIKNGEISLYKNIWSRLAHAHKFTWTQSQPIFRALIEENSQLAYAFADASFKTFQEDPNFIGDFIQLADVQDHKRVLVGVQNLTSRTWNAVDVSGVENSLINYTNYMFRVATASIGKNLENQLEGFKKIHAMGVQFFKTNQTNNVKKFYANSCRYYSTCLNENIKLAVEIVLTQDLNDPQEVVVFLLQQLLRADIDARTCEGLFKLVMNRAYKQQWIKVGSEDEFNLLKVISESISSIPPKRHTVIPAVYVECEKMIKNRNTQVALQNDTKCKAAISELLKVAALLEPFLDHFAATKNFTHLSRIYKGLAPLLAVNPENYQKNFDLFFKVMSVFPVKGKKEFRECLALFKELLPIIGNFFPHMMARILNRVELTLVQFRDDSEVYTDAIELYKVFASISCVKKVLLEAQISFLRSLLLYHSQCKTLPLDEIPRLLTLVTELVDNWEPVPIVDEIHVILLAIMFNSLAFFQSLRGITVPKYKFIRETMLLLLRNQRSIELFNRNLSLQDTVLIQIFMQTSRGELQTKEILSKAKLEYKAEFAAEEVYPQSHWLEGISREEWLKQGFLSDSYNYMRDHVDCFYHLVFEEFTIKQTRYDKINATLLALPINPPVKQRYQDVYHLWKEIGQIPLLPQMMRLWDCSQEEFNKLCVEARTLAAQAKKEGETSGSAGAVALMARLETKKVSVLASVDRVGKSVATLETSLNVIKKDAAQLYAARASKKEKLDKIRSEKSDLIADLARRELDIVNRIKNIKELETATAAAPAEKEK